MKKITTLSVLCSTLTACPAFAGGNPAAEPSDAISDALSAVELNPVVVTGTGVHQRLKDTPVPVEVITGTEIRDASLDNLQDALTMLVPSLSFSPNAMGSYLRMNGLTNSHVLVLLNGKKLTGDISGNVDLGQIDINLIERVEVLNGAASTLYGSDAVGGVINIIMCEPTEMSEFSSNSRYARKNRFDQSLNLSLRAGKVGSVTAYNYQHSDGWQNSHFTEGDEGLEPTIAQLSLGYTSNNFSQRFTYDPTERISLYAGGTYYNRLLDRPVERPDIQGGTKYNTFSESWSWQAGGEYSLGSLTHRTHTLFIMTKIIGYLLLTLCALAAPAGLQARRAMLVAHYGSSDDATRAATIDKITANIRSAVPGIEVRQAYISPVVRALQLLEL